MQAVLELIYMAMRQMDIFFSLAWEGKTVEDILMWKGSYIQAFAS